MERTLLLVDDEENVLSSLTRLLRRDGYRILRAGSGSEGLDVLAAHPVGVIISDQRMPEMTGAEFLSKVKEAYPDTVRIMLSGYTELNSVTDAINRGAIYKFLTKPWDDNLLRSNVEEAFQRYEMKMENLRLGLELQKVNEELMRANLTLEQRAEDKSREALRNLDMLRVSQEILEHLPVAVVGIDEDGMIAVANRLAQQLFGSGGTKQLLGEAAETVIPPALLDCAFGRDGAQQSSTSCLLNGVAVECWGANMGEISHSRGRTLVVDPSPSRNKSCLAQNPAAAGNTDG